MAVVVYIVQWPLRAKFNFRVYTLSTIFWTVFSEALYLFVTSIYWKKSCKNKQVFRYLNDLHFYLVYNAKRLVKNS